MALEARAAEITAELGDDADGAIALHPGAPERYRRKVEHLAETLRQAAPGDRAEAIAAVRELIVKVTVIPKGRREPVGLEIEGELAALLSRDGKPSRGTLVAGVGFEPTTFRL